MWEVKNNGQVIMESSICLLPMLTDQSRYLRWLHQNYQQGHYPFSGGLLEQPNLYLQAMRIL